MPNAPIDPLTGPRYALDGRVVTMDAARTVLERGTIYIDGGVIKALLPSDAPKPAGFKGCRVVRTGDTIYPGLIELHNHLSYNVLPMWLVPRKFNNRGEWPRHRDYRKLISGPLGVLGRTADYIPAVVRYVEAKCLFGGVTTSQGIALYSNNLTRRYYRGIVRNAEETNDQALPEAKTRISDVEARDAAKFLERLKKSSTLLLHLSEGVDSVARDHFRALKISGRKWAITDALAGIHCAGLKSRDFATLRSRGGTMIWSPLSNLLLYGGTADIAAAKREGVVIGLGSDWSPSGSKNLLGEMKVAYLVGQEHGDLFSAQEILAMATVNAARILKWDQAIGSIEPGKRADLMVVNGRRGDPYDHLLGARDTSITFVVIKGVWGYGKRRLMKHFGKPAEREAWKVGDSERELYLKQETQDPIVAALTLRQAKDRLSDGLKRLPELALDLENPVTAMAVMGVSIGGEPGAWFLDLDHEDFGAFVHRPQLPMGGDLTGMFAPAAASQPLSQILEPRDLDPLTVVDDSEYFERLAAQPNVPEYIKTELPPLYGEPAPKIPEPGAAGTTSLGPTSTAASTLPEFLATSGDLTLAERRLLVEQALLLLEQTYVHLTLKRSMHAVDPVQRLRLLSHQLASAKDETVGPEIDFHKLMTEIFTSVHDLHTNYLLPSPFRDRTAFLPFMVEEYFDADRLPHYIVSKVVPGYEHPTFVPGVEILYWNGVPTRRAIELNSEEQAGSNPDAQFARGLDAMTIRPMVRTLPPAEEWVIVTYRALDGRELEIRREWQVWSPASGIGVDPNSGQDVSKASALAFDVQTDAVNQAKKILYARKAFKAEQEMRAKPELVQVGEAIATNMPTVFRAKAMETAHGTFAYIRIFTFNVPSADAFVDEFVRLAEALPQEGLIIDVRGNGGGLIYAAEQLLQVLTPRRIQPEPAQFITTPLMLGICEVNQPSPLDRNFNLGAWVPSMRQAVPTGSVYSTGHTITPEAWANRVGQRYYGPVTLITDALCYSATDMFAAGFKDHRIGDILGTSGNTGAGGANVWTHGLLIVLAAGLVGTPLGNPFKPLPRGAGMRVSVRRTMRVGEQAGMPVEDLGVEPDHRHYMTRRDLIEGNTDLIDRAAELLVGKLTHPLAAEVSPLVAGSVDVKLTTKNIDWVAVQADERPLKSYDVSDGTTRRTLGLPAGATTLEFIGYHGAKLVARNRQDLS